MQRRSTVSFVQEIRSELPESHEKTSISCHCERSEAISWPIGGLLRRLRRLARMGRVEEFKFPEGKIHYLLNENTVPAANRCTADLRSALLDQAEPGDTLFARALRSHFEPG